jgi:hypothetical protein
MKTRKAAEVSQKFFLGDAAARLLTPELTAAEFLNQLIQQQQYVDAVRFLAYALPRKDAIRWASLCARASAGANPSEKISAALDVVEKWLANQTDENRRAAWKAAQDADFKTPAGNAALAVYFNDGSLAPPDMPVLPPEDSLTPNSVAAAVFLSAVSDEPAKAPEKYPILLAEGLKLVSG